MKNILIAYSVPIVVVGMVKLSYPLILTPSVMVHISDKENAANKG